MVVSAQGLQATWGNACRTYFLLHANYGTTWSWNKLVLTTTDMYTCSYLDVEAAARIWVDASTGSVYGVGGIGTDNADAPNPNPSQQREFLLRNKTK